MQSSLVVAGVVRMTSSLGEDGGSDAIIFGGGWWFGLCSTSALNMDYYDYWSVGDVYDVRASRMMVKAY